MAAPLAAPLAPARARTNLHSVAGDTQWWGVNHDSPLVTALPFMGWQPAAAGARRKAHRLSLVGALLPAACKPDEAELRRLRARMLLTVEFSKDATEELAFRAARRGWRLEFKLRDA